VFWLFVLLAIFGGWCFLSLVGVERDARIEEFAHALKKRREAEQSE
jgi:hypothetical protein